MVKHFLNVQSLLKSNNFTQHVRADTAGSAEMISKNKDKSKGAIASSLKCRNL